MIRALIVDDEPLARRGIRTRLLRDADDVEILMECTNGREAADHIRSTKPDLVFLDIQMPGMDGFDVIDAVGIEEMPVVIFVTAYDRHAVRAFDVHALDYVLKPIDDDRFAEALARARAHIDKERQSELGRRVASLMAERKGRDQRFVIKSGARISFVAADEIDWVEAAGDYVRLHAGKKAHLLRETMSKIEARLGEVFLRIHRSTIVNADRIRELETYFNGEYFVILEDGTKLKLSRSYRDRLQAFLGEDL